MPQVNKVLCACFSIWQTSKMTWTLGWLCDGSWKLGLSAVGCKSAPRSLRIEKCVDGPSHMRETTLTPTSDNLRMHWCTKVALSEPVIPSVRKYAIGAFQWLWMQTAISTSTSVATGMFSLSIFVTIHSHNVPSILFMSDLMCFIMAISSIIREQSVSSPLASASVVSVWRGWYLFTESGIFSVAAVPSPYHRLVWQPNVFLT